MGNFGRAHYFIEESLKTLSPNNLGNSNNFYYFLFCNHHLLGFILIPQAIGWSSSTIVQL